MRRLFIVGCPRSGTTIIQRELSRRLGFWTLPETGFFVWYSYDRNGQFRVWRPSGGRALFRLWHSLRGLPAPKKGVFARLVRHAHILVEIASRHGFIAATKAEFSLRAASNILVRELDGQAMRTGSAGWIDKTPRHFACLNIIRDYVPGSQFIFVLRNGIDTAASIRDRAISYPDEFSSEFPLSAIASLINSAVQCAVEEIGAPDVAVIHYEDFVADPGSALSEACEKLGLNVELDRALHLESSSGVAFISDMEPWKERSRGAIEVAESKVERVFSRKEIVALKQLLRTDLEAKLLKSCVPK